MNLQTLALFTLSLLLIIGAPLYVLYRNSMIKVTAKSANFSKRRVIRVTLINMSLISIASIFFILMYIGIMNFNLPKSPQTIILSLIFFITLSLCFYGTGIYITSIVLEAFTLPSLAKIKSYKTQFIATSLFHGPISHILIYSGFLIALFLLSVLESYINFPSQNNMLLIFLAAPSGLIFAFSQIYNKTYIYQLTTALTCELFLLIINKIFYLQTVGSYFLVFDATVCLTLVLYIFYQKTLRSKAGV